MEDQVLQLYALRAGILDQFSVEQVKRFKREFGPLVREWSPQLVADLRTQRKLTPELKKLMDENLKRYLQDLMKEGPA